MRVIITVLVQNLWLNRITFSCVRKQEYALPGVSKRSLGAQAPLLHGRWPPTEMAQLTPLMKWMLKNFLTVLFYNYTILIKEN